VGDRHPPPGRGSRGAPDVAGRPLAGVN
jgi:hypothetical protein